MSKPSVHILGIGNLGKLLAHSLRKRHPDIPITLLFHRPNLVEEWDKAGRCIDIIRDGKKDPQGGIHHEDISKARGHIENLIIATKTHATVNAMRPLKGRLSPSSTLLFLQNGIGTVEEVNSEFFSQASSQPRYLAGIVSHGVYTTSQFSSVHAGMASAVFGPVLSYAKEKDATGDANVDSPLIKAIVGCPELVATQVTGKELLHAQLQKLAINAIVNPLSAILDCVNGGIFESAKTVLVIDQLLEEISSILLAIIKAQEGAVEPEILERFSQKGLRATVHHVGSQVAKNISSMRQDVLAGRKTEIDYINGYIVGQGDKFDIPCPLNTKIVGLIKNKAKLSAAELSAELRVVR